MSMSTRHNGVHRADCSIWDTPPDARPEALIAAGVNDETVVRYCGSVRPIYDAYKRVLGQLSGVLLLAQSGADDPGWRDKILATAAEQTEEARDRLGGVRAAPSVARHHDALVSLGERIAGLRAEIDRAALIVGDHDQWDRLIATLFSIHRSLLAASEPRAGMTPVDFSHACCSCGVGSSQKQVPQE